MPATKPETTNARVAQVVRAEVCDESGETREAAVAGEYPLTVYVDKRETVTLMTLGQMPEALAIGWLRNQRLAREVGEIESVCVDWEVHSAAVAMRESARGRELPEKRTVTTGCGQGTMFGDFMEELDGVSFSRGAKLSPDALFDLLAQVRARDTVYKEAGAVHACLLAAHEGARADILVFVEDVGRHNAADSIAGWMWLNEVCGGGKIFYTTGRLTSEMVIKCAQMGIPYLVSRSGCTRMGLEIARQTGVTMIGRALNKRYIVFSGGEYLQKTPPRE